MNYSYPSAKHFTFKKSDVNLICVYEAEPYPDIEYIKEDNCYHVFDSSGRKIQKIECKDKNWFEKIQNAIPEKLVAQNVFIDEYTHEVMILPRLVIELSDNIPFPDITAYKKSYEDLLKIHSELLKALNEMEGKGFIDIGVNLKEFELEKKYNKII